ncbi:unnamed protein product [Paramecium octaurelia]|uniref:Myosin motor domain-containing protein n=1 Tax=Paramecium octaurelia TaxID=43137 RepID=A0A8S1WPQ7_PAROT|nr:unnamed protein product [Paramecium octaurelia]
MQDNDSSILKSITYFIDHSNSQINTSNQCETPVADGTLFQLNEAILYNIADIPNPSQNNIISILKCYNLNKNMQIGLGDNNILLLNSFSDIIKHKDQNIHDFLNTHQNNTDQQNTPSHILNLVEKAKQACFSQNNNLKTSSIIIQGNSGSGKTEAFNMILNYITVKSNSELQTNNSPSIEKNIVSTKIILNSFGNAKTINNPNSSRYGLNLQIHFDNQKKIIGAKIITILFEENRIIQTRKMKRNFHIFYQLYIAYQRIQDLKHFVQQKQGQFKGIDEEIGKLELNSYFAILGSQHDNESDQRFKVDDFENFKTLLLAFMDLNFSLQDIINIIQCLAGLIHLYEHNFTKAQQLLKIENLETAINSRISNSNQQSKKVQMEYIINSIIMDFYNKLFQWIQNKINLTLSSGLDENQQYILNIFDSFGLDIVENAEGVQKNKLEQLMQNYVYEKLLNTFYKQIIENAQNLFQSEKLSPQLDKIKTNDQTIALFENVIFDCLRNFNQQQDKTLKDMIKQQVQNFGVENVFVAEPIIGKNLRESQRSQYQMQSKIGIKHTGDELHYYIDAFIENNTFPVRENIQNINVLSQNQIIKSFTLQPQNQSRVHQAQKAINDLIKSFGVSQTFFVKCFSTNYGQANSQDSKVIETELRQSGIEQAALLLYQSYFLRIPKQEFVAKYLDKFQTIKTEEKLIHYINFCNIDKELYYFGSNNVLIKEHLNKSLDDVYQKHLESLHLDQEYISYSSKVKEVIQNFESRRQNITNEIQKRDAQIIILEKKVAELEKYNLELQEIQISIFKNNAQLKNQVQKYLESQDNQENQKQNEESIGQFRQIQ